MDHPLEKHLKPQFAKFGIQISRLERVRKNRGPNLQDLRDLGRSNIPTPSTLTSEPFSKYLPKNIGKKRGYDASDVNLPSQGEQINFVPFWVVMSNEKIADEDEIDLRYAKNSPLIFRSPLKNSPNHFHQTHHFSKLHSPMSSEIWFVWVVEKSWLKEKF